MNIIEALNWGENELKKTASEKAYSHHNQKLDAQVLLSFCLKKPTTYLFAHFEDELTDEVIKKFHRVIERRKRHEPVAYITQQKEFYKRPFFVNQFVLIPRPETELIIDLAKEIAQEHSTIIDIGTGSGAIGVTLAIELNQPIIAIDIDKNALQVAKHNAASLDVANKISFLEGHLLDPFFEKNIRSTNEGDHMLIIANLPYIPSRHWDFLDPDVTKHEPKHALTSGVDGLDLYDKLLQQIQTNQKNLPQNINLLMEIDPSQELTLPRTVKEYFQNASIQVIYDLADKARVVSVQL